MWQELKSFFGFGLSTDERIAAAVEAEGRRVREEFQTDLLAAQKAKEDDDQIENDKPLANIVVVDRKMIVKSYNAAFVEDLRKTLGDLTLDKTDDEVVKLFVDRENEEFEEPRLDVVHSGITEEGQVQMKLDWNRAFIKHLKQNGITADTEEEAVNKYLSLITKQVAEEDTSLFDAMDPHSAQREMDEMLAAELEQAAKQVEDAQRATRKAERQNRKMRRNQG